MTQLTKFINYVREKCLPLERIQRLKRSSLKALFIGLRLTLSQFVMLQFSRQSVCFLFPRGDRAGVD
jgi:hypothetical protein